MKTWTKESALAYIYSKSIMRENGCREWQGSLTKDGYGQISAETLYEAFSVRGAHRLLFKLVTGHEYQGRKEHVLHSCDNRRCVAIKHLSVGTPQKNVDDMIAKGRKRFGITVETARLIKTLIGYGLPNNLIGELIGIKRGIVANIKGGHSWRHALAGDTQPVCDTVSRRIGDGSRG